MRHGGTSYKFAHHRTVDGERCLIWGNGIGEVLIPVASPEYSEALHDRSWDHNALVNSGEDDILNVYFRNTTRLTTFYGRLYGGGSPDDTATLTTVGTEVTTPTTQGYTPVSWATADFGAPANITTSQTTTSSVKTFGPATATWAVANRLALCSVNSGTTGTPGLIAWVALSTARTLVNTDTLDVSIAVGLD
jgi:hypothetical protein